MITEALLSLVFFFVDGLLSVLPSVDISLDSGFAETALGFLSCVLYVLPLNTVFSILSIICIIQIFRITVSLIKTIWELLPFV